MWLILMVAVFGMLALPAGAQQQHMNMPGMNMPTKGMPGMDMDEIKSTAPFRPGMGDLMTAFVQPRHTKLGRAGAVGNWDYAAYELGELREAFDNVGRLILKHGTLQIAPAIASTVKPPMDALDAAIKAKDPAAFTKAYADLTDGCNACHKSADHALIVIQVPPVSDTTVPDQNFTPAK